MSLVFDQMINLKGKTVDCRIPPNGKGTIFLYVLGMSPGLSTMLTAITIIQTSA